MRKEFTQIERECLKAGKLVWWKNDKGWRIGEITGDIRADASQFQYVKIKDQEGELVSAYPGFVRSLGARQD